MIEINEKFKIDSDENQFILKEIGTVQDETSKNFGEQTQTILGYFGTVEQALICLEKIMLRRAIRTKDYTLKEAVELMRSFNNELINCIQGGKQNG